MTRTNPVTGAVEPIPAVERINALIEHPRTRELIRSLDAQTLYGLINEAGINDSMELILFASPKQVQAIVDFDCWTRDTFEVDRFAEWLDLLLQRDDRDFEAMMRKVDLEPFVLWLRSKCAVFVWESDFEALDAIDAPVVSSPDGTYALAVPEEETSAPLIRHLLDRVYAIDLAFGKKILEAARWELDSEMTESGYRAREARLGDLGFVPLHEAHEVYATLDPRRWAAAARGVAADPGSRPLTLSAVGQLPPVDAQIQALETQRFTGDGSVFTKALGVIPLVFDEDDVPSIVDSLLSQFRALVNRAHVADLGRPGDAAGARRATARADAYLSIGLELAAGEDFSLAARVLGTAPLRDIHRAGYNATARLAHEAKRLTDRGNLTLVDGQLSLLESDDVDLFEGLRARRPTLSGTLETPFQRLADVEAVARRLSEIAFAELVTFATFRHTRDELAAMIFDTSRCISPVENVTFRVLFATRVVGELAHPGLGLEPIRLDRLQQTLAGLGDKDAAHSTLTATGLRLVAGGDTGAGTLAGITTAYAARVAGWILDEVGADPRKLPERIASQVFLIAP